MPASVCTVVNAKPQIVMPLQRYRDHAPARRDGDSSASKPCRRAVVNANRGYAGETTVLMGKPSSARRKVRQFSKPEAVTALSVRARITRRVYKTRQRANRERQNHDPGSELRRVARARVPAAGTAAPPTVVMSCHEKVEGERRIQAATHVRQNQRYRERCFFTCLALRQRVAARTLVCERSNRAPASYTVSPETRQTRASRVRDPQAR